MASHPNGVTPLRPACGSLRFEPRSPTPWRYIAIRWPMSVYELSMKERQVRQSLRVRQPAICDLFDGLSGCPQHRLPF